MGWLFTHREKGITDREWFDRESIGLDENGQSRILDCATINRSEWYAAVRAKDNLVYAAVYLIRWVRDDFNFGWKSMSESSGPGYYNCPERILKLLSPLEELYTPRTDGADGSYEWAKNWREKCWLNIERKKRLRVGSAVELSMPIRFTNGRELQHFVIASLKPFRLRPVNGYGYYRMNMRDMLYRIANIYDSEQACLQATLATSGKE